MNKNNPLKKYSVYKDAQNKHHIFYGDINDYSEEDIAGLQIVHEKDYSAQDFAEILGNILEDNNFHSMTFVGNEVLASLEKVSCLSHEDKADFMRDFVYGFIKNHGLR